VVRAGGDDDALVSGGVFCHAHGEVVGFGSGAGEHDMAQFGREGGEELLGVIEDGFLDVTGVGVQGLHLFVDSCNDLRVGVADRRDVVVNVEVLISLPVKERHSLATDDFDRGVVKEPVTGSEALVPAPDVLLHQFRELTETGGIKAVDHGLRRLADSVGSVAHGFLLEG
jgi:hypothetical protein